MTEANAHRPRQPASPSSAGETLALALLAAAVCVLLRQTTPHGLDWRYLILWLDEPGAVHPQHPGYLPLARLVRGVLAPLGVDTWTALCAFSAVGVAVAVAAMHRASLAMGGDRGFARCAALLLLLLPAVLHFGTVVELHAPFLGALALAVAFAVRQARAGTMAGAVATGTLAGIATTLHATGHLFVPPIVFACWWWRRRSGSPTRPGQHLALVGSHAVVWSGAFVALRAAGHLPGTAQPALGEQGLGDQPLRFLADSLRDASILPHVWPALLGEWLLPLLPLSVLVSGALLRRDLRAWAGWFLLLLAGLLVVTIGLLHGNSCEHGAYLLPLAMPAAWLVLRAVPRRTWPGLLAGTAACGLLLRGEDRERAPDLAFGRAAVALARSERTVFLVADLPELNGLWRCDVRAQPFVARNEYDTLRALTGDGGAEPTAAEVEAWLQLLRLQARQQHARLLVTDRAVQWLTQRLPAFAAAWSRFLAASAAQRVEPSAGVAGVIVR